MAATVGDKQTGAEATNSSQTISLTTTSGVTHVMWLGGHYDGTDRNETVTWNGTSMGTAVQEVTSVNRYLTCFFYADGTARTANMVNTLDTSAEQNNIALGIHGASATNASGSDSSSGTTPSFALSGVTVGDLVLCWFSGNSASGSVTDPGSGTTLEQDAWQSGGNDKTYLLSRQATSTTETFSPTLSVASGNAYNALLVSITPAAAGGAPDGSVAITVLNDIQ